MRKLIDLLEAAPQDWNDNRIAARKEMIIRHLEGVVELLRADDWEQAREMLEFAYRRVQEAFDHDPAPKPFDPKPPLWRQT
jgi:hypothetical protein